MRPNRQEIELKLQLGQMWATGKQWLKEHPKADVKIVWNYNPERVHVIKPISNAMKEKFVILNPDALALMKSMWRWDVQSEPTVSMMRVVVESLKEEKEPDLFLCLKQLVFAFTEKHQKIFILGPSK